MFKKYLYAYIFFLNKRVFTFSTLSYRYSIIFFNTSSYYQNFFSQLILNLIKVFPFISSRIVEIFTKFSSSQLTTSIKDGEGVARWCKKLAKGRVRSRVRYARLELIPIRYGRNIGVDLTSAVFKLTYLRTPR